jgi:hypothetical protein
VIYTDALASGGISCITAKISITTPNNTGINNKILRIMYSLKPILNPLLKRFWEIYNFVAYNSNEITLKRRVQNFGANIKKRGDVLCVLFIFYG